MSAELGFKGRVVIITGSSKGLGRAYATTFAARGARVVINGRSRGPVEEAVAELVANGGEAMASIGDVSTEADANALVQQTIRHYGRLDVVVNNAGILNNVSFAEMSAAIFDEMMDVNVRSTFLVTRAAWPHLIQQGYGRVLVSPSRSVYGAANIAHYSTSKAALVGLMRSLSLAGQPHGINVNAIFPFAYSEMFAASVARGDSLAQKNSADAFAAAPRLLDAKLVAPAVASLSHENCKVTGEMVQAGGGSFARMFLAQGPNYFDPNPSPESVRDNWSAICQEAGYTVPGGGADSLMPVLQRVGLAPITP